MTAAKYVFCLVTFVVNNTELFLVNSVMYKINYGTNDLYRPFWSTVSYQKMSYEKDIKVYLKIRPCSQAKDVQCKWISDFVN